MTRAEKISVGVRRAWAKRPRGPGLAEMEAAAEPGMCPFCDDRLAVNTQGRKAHTCGDEVCRTAWMRCYQRDRRRLIREMLAASERLQNAAQSPETARLPTNDTEGVPGHG